MPPLDAEIRDRVGQYLAGEQSLHEFLEWFIPVSADIDQSDDRRAEDLAGEILLRWAEFTNGDWTEAELKAQLERLVGADSPRPGQPHGQPAA